MSSNRRRFAFPMIVAVAAAVLLFPVPARAESTFDQIKHRRIALRRDRLPA